MPEELQQDLQKNAVGLPVSVKCLRGDSLQYLLQADLIVSMAGYNTICEILKFSKKAVVIPRAGPSAEQGIRSRILHKLELLRSIHPRDLTPELLAKSICARLDEPKDAAWPPAPDLNGAIDAARLLIS